MKIKQILTIAIALLLAGQFSAAAYTQKGEDGTSTDRPVQTQDTKGK